MAQVEEKNGAFAERALLLMRQRPLYALGAVLVVGVLLGASVFGIAQAQEAGGIVIETSDGSDADDGSDEDAAAADDSGDAAADEGDDVSASDELETIVVDVDGAVASPQVVELPAGSRVADAIDAAGGLTDEADVSGINRAAVLTDGEKIYIPEEGEEVTESSSSSSDSSSTSDTSSSSSSSGLVNINTADADELDTLPGVGPSTAQAIIEDREANGAFTCIEDIMRVSGIGEAKFANMKDLICV